MLRPVTFHHLLWKELFRCLIAGGFAAFVIAIMPQLLRQNVLNSELLVGFISLVSFIFFNSIFNILAAGVTNLIVNKKQKRRNSSKGKIN